MQSEPRTSHHSFDHLLPVHLARSRSFLWVELVHYCLNDCYCNLAGKKIQVKIVRAGHHCFYIMATNIYDINQSVRYLDLMLHWWWRRRRVTTLIPASWMICDWWRGWRLSRWPHWRWSRRPLNWWCRSRPCPASCCP